MDRYKLVNPLGEPESLHLGLPGTLGSERRKDGWLLVQTECDDGSLGVLSIPRIGRMWVEQSRQPKLLPGGRDGLVPLRNVSKVFFSPRPESFWGLLGIFSDGSV